MSRAKHASPWIAEGGYHLVAETVFSATNVHAYYLEHEDDLKRRVEEASRYVSLERLTLTPQYGFASTIQRKALIIEEEWAKLRLVADTARELWGALESRSRLGLRFLYGAAIQPPASANWRRLSCAFSLQPSQAPVPSTRSCRWPKR